MNDTPPMTSESLTNVAGVSVIASNDLLGRCEVCGKQKRRKKSRACGQSCGAKLMWMHRKKMPDQVCPHCGKTFHAPHSHKNKYCSISCNSSANRTLCRLTAKSKIKRVKNLLAAQIADPRLGPYETNKAAVEWSVISPRGVPFNFRNLRHFLREHPEHFNPLDVQWSRSGKDLQTCRAYWGLSSIRPRKSKFAWSWKGWTWNFIRPNESGSPTGA